MDIKISNPFLPPFNEYVEEIKELWGSGQITNNGIKLKELERKLKEYLNVYNISLFTNGHTALEIAIEALGLRGEVITTPYTFASTPLAIVRKGLTPIFCDIKQDYTINEELIENVINEKTCAIIPVHVYGNVCNVERIDSIAKQYNIPVIYDAAHAFGVKKNGVGIGNFGDISMFSFHATKVFNTVEGGGLTYRSVELNNVFSEMRNFGISGEETKRNGTNAKMTELHAAMGLCNLRYIDENIKKRKKLVDLYDNLLKECKGIRLNERVENVTSNYAYYPIRIITELKGETRDNVLKRLADNGVYARKYYSPLVTELPIYEKKVKVNCPLAKCIADEVITLPLHTDLKERDVLS